MICSKCIIFLVTDDGRSVVNNKEFSTKGFYFWFIFQIASDRIFLKRILCRVINADGFTRKVKISLRRTKLLSYERFYFIYLLFIFNRTYTRSNHIIIFPSVAILDSCFKYKLFVASRFYFFQVILFSLVPPCISNRFHAFKQRERRSPRRGSLNGVRVSQLLCEISPTLSTRIVPFPVRKENIYSPSTIEQ